MPKSKGRNTKSKQRSYVPKPKPKKQPKKSPKWYGPMVISVMIAGVLIIVLNYIGIFGNEGDPKYLYAGLGTITLGFLLATGLR